MKSEGAVSICIDLHRVYNCRGGDAPPAGNYDAIRSRAGAISCAMGPGATALGARETDLAPLQLFYAALCILRQPPPGGRIPCAMGPGAPALGARETDWAPLQPFMQRYTF